MYIKNEYSLIVRNVLMIFPPFSLLQQALHFLDWRIEKDKVKLFASDEEQRVYEKAFSSIAHMVSTL